MFVKINIIRINDSFRLKTLLSRFNQIKFQKYLYKMKKAINIELLFDKSVEGVDVLKSQCAKGDEEE